MMGIGCRCARAASGHPAAALLRTPKNSRRLILRPQAHEETSYRLQRALSSTWVGKAPLRLKLQMYIIERTDGVPLSVEEMAKAVLEAESEGEARRAVAVVPSPALAERAETDRLRFFS